VEVVSFRLFRQAGRVWVPRSCVPQFIAVLREVMGVPTPVAGRRLPMTDVVEIGWIKVC